MKRRVLYYICQDDAIKLEDLCLSERRKDNWGSEYYVPAIDMCLKRHKKDYCSGFSITVHGKTFYRSDLLNKNAGRVPYYKDINKVFSVTGTLGCSS